MSEPVNCYLFLRGIPGEVAAPARFKGWIEVLSWSFGRTDNISMGAGGGAGKLSMGAGGGAGKLSMGAGGGAGKLDVTDLSLTKFMDMASPFLMQHAATGKQISDGQLVGARIQSSSIETVFTFDLKDILVGTTRYGAVSWDQRSVESLTLNFLSGIIIAGNPGTAGAQGRGQKKVAAK